MTISSRRPLTFLVRANISFSMKNAGENVVRIEAEALRALADRIAGPMAADFNRAVDCSTPARAESW